ncbi:MAG TPA: FHA domain-containing protein [Pirellulaceae bacterium]|nr:FHA domain-containing protein [Pirellulaceae bacterium]
MDVPIYRLDQYSLPQPQSLPGQALVELEITRGRVQQRLRPVHSKIFLIGAAHDCDLVLGDLQFPEAYAYLFVSGCEVSIRRLGAGPELTVCGQAVEGAELFHGDRIAFGPFELRVRIESAAGGLPDNDGYLPQAESGLMARDRRAAVDEVESLLLDIRRGLADDPPVASPPIRPLATSGLPPLPRSLASPNSSASSRAYREPHVARS